MPFFTPIKGRDIGLEIIKPTKEIVVMNDGGIDLGEIDMLEDMCTYQRINIRNGIVGQQVVTFKFALIHYLSEVRKNREWQANKTKFPQRHTIDIALYGANGPNGFLGAAGGWSSDNSDYLNISYKLPSQFAQLLNIYTYEATGTGSSISRSWSVDEDDAWFKILESGEGDIPDNRNIVNEMYTRSCDYHSCAQYGVTNKDELNRMKALNLFYSPSNIVIFRCIMELYKTDKYLTVRKFAGAEGLS